MKYSDIPEGTYTLFGLEIIHAQVFFLWDNNHMVYDFWSPEKASEREYGDKICFDPIHETLVDARIKELLKEYIVIERFENAQEFKDWIVENYFDILL